MQKLHILGLHHRFLATQDFNYVLLTVADLGEVLLSHVKKLGPDFRIWEVDRHSGLCSF